MEQVAQCAPDGRSVIYAPESAFPPGWLLVANRASLISAGSERAKFELGGRSLLQGGKSLLRKVRALPDLVREVIERAGGEAIGYSSAGTFCLPAPGTTTASGMRRRRGAPRRSNRSGSARART
jgi:hypothetical protein